MKKWGKRLLLGCAAAALLAVGLYGAGRVWSHIRAYVPPDHALYILMYHQVAEDGAPCNDMTVTVSRLREDLQWLKAHGYTSVLPRELAAGEPLPERPVLITFDDGYESSYDLLYPLLREEEMKAVISVIVRMPDRGIEEFLSWEMCREMADSGLVEIGSHSYALHNLGEREGNYEPGGVNGIGRIPGESDRDFESRVLDDIRKSYDLIAENLGQPPTFFAYPFGETEPDATALVEELFPVTVVTGWGTADVRKGFHDMPRYTVTMGKAVGGMLPQ